MPFHRGSPRRHVLDANALVAYFEGRQPAGQKIRSLFEEALRLELTLFMSAVNWGEVFYVEWRIHGEPAARVAESNLHRLPILVVAADLDRATRAAALKQKHNLGYADSFAAELAIEQGAWLVTADPEFSRLGKMISLYPLSRHQK